MKPTLKFNATAQEDARLGTQSGTVKNIEVNKYTNRLIRINDQRFYECEPTFPCYLGNYVELSIVKFGKNFVAGKQVKMLRVTAGRDCQIMSACRLEKCTLGNNVQIMPMIGLENCVVGSDVIIRRERMDMKYKNGLPTVMGFFTEIKNAVIPDNSVVFITEDNKYRVTPLTK